MVDPPVHIPKESDPEKHLRWGLGILAFAGLFQLHHVFQVAPRADFSHFSTATLLVGEAVLGGFWIALAVGRLAAPVVAPLLSARVRRPGRTFRLVAAELSVLAALALGALFLAVPAPVVAVEPGVVLSGTGAGFGIADRLGRLMFHLPQFVGCLLVASGVGRVLDVTDDYSGERTLRAGFAEPLCLVLVGLWALLAFDTLAGSLVFVAAMASFGFLCLAFRWTGAHLLFAWAALTAWSILPPYSVTVSPGEAALFALSASVCIAALADLCFRLSPDTAKHLAALTPSDG